MARANPDLNLQKRIQIFWTLLKTGKRFESFESKTQIAHITKNNKVCTEQKRYQLQSEHLGIDEFFFHSTTREEEEVVSSTQEEVMHNIDDSKPIRYRWENDPECSKFGVHFGTPGSRKCLSFLRINMNLHSYSRWHFVSPSLNCP